MRLCATSDINTLWLLLSKIIHVLNNNKRIFAFGISDEFCSLIRKSKESGANIHTELFFLQSEFRPEQYSNVLFTSLHSQIAAENQR